jgi:hypothetical protein
MGLHHVSHSALNLFDECAMRYKALRIEKVPEPVSRLLVDGILAHATIERYVHELYESNLDRYAGGIPELVQQVMTENERIDSTASYKSVLITTMTFAKYFVLDPDSVFELEMKCEAPMGDGYPLMLSYIDQVDRRYDADGEFLLVIDRKTGWATEQTEGNNFQLDIYGWQLHQRYPDMRIGVQNHFVRRNIFTSIRMLSEWDYDNTVRRAQTIYNRMQAAYEKRDYPTNPGKYCAYCPIAAKCPAIQGLVAQKHAIIDVETGRDRLRELVVLEAAAKQLKGTLKTFVDVNGPFALDDGLGVGYKTSEPSITLTSLEKAYEVLGDELFDILNVDGKKIKKYEDDPRLDGLWGTKPGKTTFKIGKGAGDEEVPE